MRLLILGGTQFCGRHMVESARKSGHEVTLFNRGKSNQDLFPDVEKRVGDRNGDLTSLEEGAWDAVIDVSGYVPSQVKATTNLLKDRVKHYTFISTISVYEDFTKGPVIEGETKLGELTEDTEEVTGGTYGPLKQLSEEIVKETFGERSLCIRPGLIVGPDDTTDRFTYWVNRVGEGGSVLVPGEPSREIQWIDVRDLTEWIIRMVEKEATGTYNAAGLTYYPSMEEYVTTVKKVTNSDAVFQWVSDDVLTRQGAFAFVEVPFWIPRSETYPDGFILADATKAIEQGLTFRSAEETIRDTFIWQAARKGHQWKAGLTSEKEKSILSSI
ncbi:NAD-dependent epimerase/dehydratase family protein [Jeotgalibacillus marinus]|uniref:NAD-dependent epimerase/dehydratase family protein n=1 Tax=Jeotgalibacillus marinus TaxID=86667 RepID=A0ABV3Q0C6_9BACL